MTPAIAITCTGVATGTHVGREKAVAAAGRLPHQGLRHARGAGARVVWRCSPSARIRRLARSAALRRRIRERRRFGRNLGRESLPAYEWSGRSGQFCGAREVHALYGGGGRPAVHIAGDKGAYVAAGTDQGHIKVWNIERREPKQHAAGRRLVPERSRITSVQVRRTSPWRTVELQAAPELPAPDRASASRRSPGVGSILEAFRVCHRA